MMLAVAAGILLSSVIIGLAYMGLYLVNQEERGYGLDGQTGWFLIAFAAIAGAAIIASQII